MRCPDNEKLNLFIDKELSKEELLTIEKHLVNCEICKAEINAIYSCEQKIKETFSEISKHSLVNKVIMEKIRLDDKQILVAEKEPKRKDNFFRFFVPAFFIVSILALVINFFPKSGVKYSGSVHLISCKAKDSEALFNNKIIGKELEFIVQPLEVNNFAGQFDFNVVASKTKAFNWNGTGTFSISESGNVYFKEGSGKFSNLSSFTININSGSRSYVLRTESIDLSKKSKEDVKTDKCSSDELSKPVVTKINVSPAVKEDSKGTDPKKEVALKELKKVYNPELEQGKENIEVDSQNGQKVKKMTNPFDEKPIGTFGE
jgi:hypothetical protein